MSRTVQDDAGGRPPGLRLRVEVASAPVASTLRAAIEAALDGRPWMPGPEATVAAAVAEAVRAAAPTLMPEGPAAGGPRWL